MNDFYFQALNFHERRPDDSPTMQITTTYRRNSYLLSRDAFLKIIFGIFNKRGQTKIMTFKIYVYSLKIKEKMLTLGLSVALT